MNTVSYYGSPIKHIMLRGGNDVAYCLWNDGIRLISLNGWNVKHLNNSDYSLLFNLVAEKEGVKL